MQCYTLKRIGGGHGVLQVGHLSLDVEVRFDVVLGAEKLVEKRALPSHRVDVEQGLALLFFNVGARVVLE